MPPEQVAAFRRQMSRKSRPLPLHNRGLARLDRCRCSAEVGKVSKHVDLLRQRSNPECFVLDNSPSKARRTRSRSQSRRTMSSSAFDPAIARDIAAQRLRRPPRSPVEQSEAGLYARNDCKLYRSVRRQPRTEARCRRNRAAQRFTTAQARNVRKHVVSGNMFRLVASFT